MLTFVCFSIKFHNNRPITRPPSWIILNKPQFFYVILFKKETMNYERTFGKQKAFHNNSSLNKVELIPTIIL